MTDMFKVAAPALLLAAALAVSACSEDHIKSVFEPEVGHPGSWIEDHGEAALSEGSTCPECHGTDLRGGVSQLSCFTAEKDGVSCHESGVGKRHTTGFALASEHGKAAKNRPGVSSGMGSCQACHGRDYQGGTSEISCPSCHGADAPHPKRPWLRSLGSHISTHELNAPVCSECHEAPETMEPPGCFNESLCHGETDSHSADWASPDQHGAKAKEDPDTGGLEECQACHGEDFRGGTSEVSCFSCHGLDAPHPRVDWEDGGPGHRSTGERNASVCSECHDELARPPDCFSGNGCHDTGGSGEEGEDDTVEENVQPPPTTSNDE